MPIVRPVTTQPAISPRDAARERAALARRWPRAVRDVLALAASIDAHNRRAVALGLAPLAADPPVSVAGPMWAAILDAAPGVSRADR